MTRRKQRKTAARSQRGPKPRKIPQPNGGALYAGGVPGNAGGTGRPSKEARAELLRLGVERFPVLTAIADGKKNKPADRLKAVDTMLRYALGERHEMISPDWIMDNLVVLRRIVREQLPKEQADVLLERIARETFQS
jgi:hypothetical protein